MYRVNENENVNCYPALRGKQGVSSRGLTGLG